MQNENDLFEIVDVANRNLRFMDGTTGSVQKIISSVDLVFGVWQDFRKPYGVGISIIKGSRRLKAVAESGTPRFVAKQQSSISLPTSWSAIICSHAAQADAAKIVFGDKNITEKFVYVIKSEDDQIKLGLSGDPKARRQNLQTGSPFPLALFHIEPCSPSQVRTVEKLAKKMLYDRRINGEWFNCTAEQAIEVVRQAAKNTNDK